MVFNGFHHLRKPSYGTAAKIIPVGKSPREYDAFEAFNLFLVMPDVFHITAEYVLDSVKAVHITVRSRKNDYTEFHFD
jgi:hypothetical protein